MKVAVTKVIDTLTQEDFHGAFQKLLERYNKCIAAGGDYFEGEVRKLNDPHIGKEKRKYWLFLTYFLAVTYELLTHI